MGIGTLRRYHARPDEGLVTDTPAPASTGAHDTPEVHEAKAAWEAAGAEAASRTKALDLIKQNLLDAGKDLSALDEDDAAKLHGAEEAAREATDAEEAAKIAFEEAEKAAIEAADALKKEQEENERRKAENPIPSRGGSKQAWRDYALANGKSEEDIEGLGRDEIAELFLGPKA